MGRPITFPTNPVDKVENEQNAAPQCAVCREREAIGKWYEQPGIDEWHWYCAQCLDDLLERLRALAINPAVALPHTSTPTRRVDTGTAHRPLPPARLSRAKEREELARLREDFKRGKSW